MRELIERLPLVPRTCTWEMTLRCNLRCGHCGSRAGAARAGGEMSRERALRVVGELAALGCRKVSLSGGEPTLAPHWTEVASAGAKRGMAMNMIVNGTIHGRGFVRRAKDAGLVGLGVSLDGLAPTHDALRGMPGLYAKVMQLLDDCAAESLPVGVITTIWRGNRRELESMHDVLVGRINTWQLQLGNAMGNLSPAEQVMPEDLLDIVPMVARLIERGRVHIDVADNIGYFGPYEETIRKRRGSPLPCWTGCPAGCRHLGIESDGGVKGCLAIQSITATEGNLQESALADIWHRPGAFAYNRDSSIAALGGFCRTCEHAAVCRGGCYSMRTCEGGENRFCYHRVATLAARRAERSERRYVAKVYAPAALLALLGLGAGCSDGTGGGDMARPDLKEPPSTPDLYGIAPDLSRPDLSSSDAGLPPAADMYGIVADLRRPDLTSPDAGVPPVGDLYGIAVDLSRPDLTSPDAGVPPVADLYGLIVDLRRPDLSSPDGK